MASFLTVVRTYALLLADRVFRLAGAPVSGVVVAALAILAMPDKANAHSIISVTVNTCSANGTAIGSTVTINYTVNFSTLGTQFFTSSLETTGNVTVSTTANDSDPGGGGPQAATFTVVLTLTQALMSGTQVRLNVVSDNTVESAAFAFSNCTSSAGTGNIVTTNAADVVGTMFDAINQSQYVVEAHSNVVETAGELGELPTSFASDFYAAAIPSQSFNDTLSPIDPSASRSPFRSNRTQPLKFRFSLRQALQNEQRPQFQRRLDSRPSVDKSYPTPESRFDAWIAGNYVDFDNDEAGADRDGQVWSLVSGISYDFSDRSTVSVFTRYSGGDVTSRALTTALDSEFFGVGAAITSRTDAGLVLSLSALVEDGDNEANIAGATGKFDSDQWNVRGSIRKRFARGRHWIEPGASILYSEANLDGYTDSTGAFVPGQNTTLGRFTFGPRMGTVISGNGRAVQEIRPHLAVRGMWDFESSGDRIVTTTAVATSGDIGINIAPGIDIAFVRGVFATFGGSYFAFDNDLDGWTLNGGFGAPLSVLGFGDISPGATLKMNFTGAKDGTSATARVRIPLQ